MTAFLDSLGPHAGFIVAAYVVTAATVAGLAGWIVLDRVTLRRRLDDLERQGIRRRSAGREPRP